MRFEIKLEGFPTETVEVTEIDGKSIEQWAADKAQEIAWDKYKSKHLRKDGQRIPAPTTPVIERV